MKIYANLSEMMIDGGLSYLFWEWSGLIDHQLLTKSLPIIWFCPSVCTAFLYYMEWHNELEPNQSFSLSKTDGRILSSILSQHLDTCKLCPNKIDFFVRWSYFALHTLCDCSSCLWKCFENTPRRICTVVYLSCFLGISIDEVINDFQEPFHWNVH